MTATVYDSRYLTPLLPPWAWRPRLWIGAPARATRARRGGRDLVPRRGERLRPAAVARLPRGDRGAVDGELRAVSCGFLPAGGATRRSDPCTGCTDCRA